MTWYAYKVFMTRLYLGNKKISKQLKALVDQGFCLSYLLGAANKN
jgi:hypothetical protein